MRAKRARIKSRRDDRTTTALGKRGTSVAQGRHSLKEILPWLWWGGLPRAAAFPWAEVLLRFQGGNQGPSSAIPCLGWVAASAFLVSAIGPERVSSFTIRVQSNYAHQNIGYAAVGLERARSRATLARLLCGIARKLADFRRYSPLGPSPGTFNVGWHNPG